jgi:hypothetical protein
MNVNEIFALPINLHQVAITDGIPLYGSKSLNDKFLDAINNSKRGKLIFGTVKIMVKQGRIIPCFADSGILRHFRRRISHDTSGGLLRLLRIIVAKKPIDHPLDYVLAFLDFSTKKIIVLISNHITEKFSILVSDSYISLSLTHEMMHMFAHQNPSKFLSLFKEELNSYYLNYFTKIFNLKDEKSVENVIEEIYKYLLLKCEIGDVVSLSNILIYIEKLKPYSNLKKDEFDKVCMDYIKVIRILLNNDMTKFISLAKEYKYLINPLYNSYKDSFGRIPNKGCTQEIIYPSEVICGYSDIKIDSKIKNALNSLK